MKADQNGSWRDSARQLRLEGIYFFAFCILQHAPLAQQDPPLQQSPANALTAKVSIKVRPIRAEVSLFITILLRYSVFYSGFYGHTTGDTHERLTRTQEESEKDQIRRTRLTRYRSTGVTA